MIAPKFPISAFFLEWHMTKDEARICQPKIIASLSNGVVAETIAAHPLYISQKLINVGIAIQKLDIQSRYVWTLGKPSDRIMHYNPYRLHLETDLAGQTMIILSGVLKAEDFSNDRPVPINFR